MVFTIPNIFFVIVSAILTIYVTYPITKGGLTDNRFSSLNKRMTTRGKQVLGVLLLIFLLQIAQEINNSNINLNADYLLKKERDERSLLIKKGVDSGHSVLYNNLSKAFANQGLKIDTLKNEIVNIKDSKQTIINNTQLYPVIRLDSSSIKFDKRIDDKSYYKIHFKSSDAGSANINIITTILIHLKDETKHLYRLNFFPDHVRILKNGGWLTAFNVKIEKDKIQKIYLHVKGTYSTLDSSNTFDINDLYQYNPLTERTNILLNKGRKEILKTINEIDLDNINTKN